MLQFVNCFLNLVILKSPLSCSGAVKGLADMVTNVIAIPINNYNEIEAKIREATSDDPWGPSADTLADLAQLTFSNDSFNQLMDHVFKRMSLNDLKKSNRELETAKQVPDHPAIFGEERIRESCLHSEGAAF